MKTFKVLMSDEEACAIGNACQIAAIQFLEKSKKCKGKDKKTYKETADNYDFMAKVYYDRSIIIEVFIVDFGLKTMEKQFTPARFFEEFEEIEGKLTEVEQEAIITLLQAHTPLSTRGVRNGIMEARHAGIFAQRDIVEKLNMRGLSDIKIAPRILNIGDEKQKLQLKLAKREITQTKYFKQLDKVFQKNDEKIPSYERIDGALQSLPLGLVSKRPVADLKRSVDGKEKDLNETDLWIVDSKLRKSYNQKRKELFETRSKHNL